MDSLTHIALGACIGDAFLGKKIGKRAMFLGALAQSAPDIDFISGSWMDITDNLLAHRGFTHSILFCIIFTFFFSIIAERWHRAHTISLRNWILFFGVEIFIHIFIDAFNNYGIGWFEPFRHYRVSFDTIYVVDPFFSIWPIISFIVLLVLKRNHPKRKFWFRSAVFLSFLYLGYCSINKIIITRDLKEIVKRQGIPHERYFSTPTPLNNWLWYIVTGNDSGYYIGYRSLFDKGKHIDFTFFPRNHFLLKQVEDQKDVHQLIRFSNQFYAIEKWGDTLVFNDLRFGQIIGWQNPREHFAFHYYLQPSIDNTLVVQRGRFAKWDWNSFHALVQRIKGIQY